MTRKWFEINRRSCVLQIRRGFDRIRIQPKMFKPSRDYCNKKRLILSPFEKENYWQKVLQTILFRKTAFGCENYENRRWVGSGSGGPAGSATILQALSNLDFRSEPAWKVFVKGLLAYFLASVFQYLGIRVIGCFSGKSATWIMTS